MKTKTLFVIVATASLFCTAVNLAVGQTWFPIASNQDWTCIASSADGVKIVAGTQFAPIYRSTDSGATWIATSTPSNVWTSIACSADGSVLVAMTTQGQDGLIYRSTNSGVDWIPTSAPGTPNGWISVACSADGRVVVAMTQPGGIYRSLDSGATWAVISAPNTKSWTSVACSADGTRFAATSDNFGLVHEFFVPGAIYFSSDSGETWSEAGGTVATNWFSIACSADGKKMIAAGGSLFFSAFLSKDSGATWTNTGVPGSSVASSADGTSLAVAGWPGLIYFSRDSGATWTATSADSRSWGFVASSADGNAWLALDAYNGLIYKSRSTPVPLLDIALMDGNHVLSWIVPSMGFALQQNSDLSTTNWKDVTITPILNLTNLQNQVMLSPTNSNGFYRLATP